MHVSKWGNSLAVRLPAKLVQELGLKEGDEIDLRRVESGVLHVEKKPDRLELLKGLRQFRGLIPADYRFSRKDAYDDGEY